MKRALIVTVALATFVALPVASWAQAKPDFSGSWTMDEAKSDPAPARGGGGGAAAEAVAAAAAGGGGVAMQMTIKQTPGHSCPSTARWARAPRRWSTSSTAARAPTPWAKARRSRRPPGMVRSWSSPPPVVQWPQRPDDDRVEGCLQPRRRHADAEDDAQHAERTADSQSGLQQELGVKKGSDAPFYTISSA